MTLHELLSTLPGPDGSVDWRSWPDERLSTQVTAIDYDSRRVRPGSVFVAMKGERADGARFGREALDGGAVAIVSETPGDAGTPTLVVPDARIAIAGLAGAFHRHPSRELSVVGVTGTNGKTTTAYLIDSILRASDIRSGLVGTVTYRTGSHECDAGRTTPEAPDLQALLREMVNADCKACVLEVSSHALTLHRVDGIRFAAATFTNLTREHLEFHGDMAAYFAAKRRLFEMLPAAAPAIVNLDDPRGGPLCEVAPKTVTYGVHHAADVMPGPISSSMAGLEFDVRTPGGSLHVRSSLVGRANVYNVLAATATGTALDLPPDRIERGVADLPMVPGRFQVVSTPEDDVLVVVDYAHTDDALKNLLETARAVAGGRVITVFGCGGDRDRSKRPLMGAVAGRMSDVVVVTSDNPRDEDPSRIIDEILRGLSASQAACEVVPDRAQAIEHAIALARVGDMVLIAGKGHEKYQVVQGRTLPFDDIAMVGRALAQRRALWLGSS